jgi:hypothetical protein
MEKNARKGAVETEGRKTFAPLASLREKFLPPVAGKIFPEITHLFPTLTGQNRKKMAANKPLYVYNGKLKMGSSMLGYHGSKTGTIRQIVHDGDTVNVRFADNLGLRFLGVDTPEVSFQQPGSDRFVNIGHDSWAAFFTNGNWKTGLDKFDTGLLAHLDQRIGTGETVHSNHARHADLAEKSLETIMTADLDLSGRPREEFELFMAFAHEFLDGYGRLLCYLNSATENFSRKTDKDAVKAFSYNERQLDAGVGMPYFIWPNVQPFISVKPFSEENVRPTQFWKLIGKASKLKAARRSVAEARAGQVGIYATTDPLILQPFELRFISRRSLPNRYVINLADTGSNRLLPPQRYYTIEHLEDRLYLPSEYLPIFLAYGWVEG